MELPRVLLVEDDPDWLEIYRNRLLSSEYELVEATSVDQALIKLHEQPIAVVLTDLKLIGSSAEFGGFDVLKQARQLSPGTQVIVITAFGNRDIAIQAMREGALDYVTKPVDYEKLAYSISNAIKVHDQYKSELKPRQQRPLRDSARTQANTFSVLGNSKSMGRVFQRILEASNQEHSVLITGELGTGKSLIAGTIHQNSIRSANEPGIIDVQHFGSIAKRIFIYLLHYRNSSIIIENLHSVDTESYLALREVARRSLLLNVRLIWTSQLGRDELIELFSDLDNGNDPATFFPSDVIIIRLYPLWQRKDGDDISSLAASFLHEYAQECATDLEFDASALGILSSMDFRAGNVAELRELIFRAASMTIAAKETVLTKQRILDLRHHVVQDVQTRQLKLVFVSYSSKDRDFVRKLTLQLKSELVEYWIDFERILFGDPYWDREVQQGLLKSDAMLLVVSPSSMESEEVGREWRYFLEMRRPIFILEYQSAEIPFRLQTIQRVQYVAENIEQIREDMIRQLFEVK